MQIAKKIIITALFTLFMFAPIATIALPANVGASVTRPEECEKRLLTFPVWFRGLASVEQGECAIIAPDKAPGGLTGFIWKIALNVIEIGLQVVAYIAVFFIIYGGFLYLTGGSNASTVEKARMTLLNAVIGLAISMGAIAIVNLIFGVLG